MLIWKCSTIDVNFFTIRITTVIRYFLENAFSFFSVQPFSSPESFSHGHSEKLSFGLDDKRERSDLLLREVLFRRS